MNISLIHPYITSDSRDTRLTEPLGLLSIATFLEKHIPNIDAQVNILDLYALGCGRHSKRNGLFTIGLADKETIVSYLRKLNPQLIGITSNFTAYADDSLEVAKLAKQALPESFVVMGGAHATMEAENILASHPYVDFIVRGEGEETFCELVEAVKDKKSRNFGDIAGLSYRDLGGVVVSNASRQLIDDFNSLPVPDRKYIDMAFYKKSDAKALAFIRNYPVTSIMTSRGCPFNCIFCSTKVMWERKWRPRSISSVINEIEELYFKYNIREFAIQDDQFIIDKERVHKICDEIIDKRLNISLSIPSGTSVWLVDEPLLRKMKRAGFYRLCFPIETGNAKSLKFIRKPVDLEKVKETIKLVNSIGFWTQGNFIIGFPYESKKDIQETIDYAYRSGLDYVIFFVAKPYAGSEMYEIYKKEGLLDSIVRASHIERSDYDTCYLSSQEINKLHSKAVRSFFIYKLFFYLNPVNFYKHLLPKFKTFGDFKYAFKIFIVLLKTKVLPLLRKENN